MHRSVKKKKKKIRMTLEISKPSNAHEKIDTPYIFYTITYCRIYYL